MGVVSMTFYKQGKRFSYLEVIETLNALITKDILPQLEEKEVSDFFLRVFEFTKEVVATYLEELGYRVMNMKQSFLTLVQLKVIPDDAVWGEAIEIYDDIIAGKSEKEEVVSFMSQKLVDAMKELNKRLGK